MERQSREEAVRHCQLCSQQQGALGKRQTCASSAADCCNRHVAAKKPIELGAAAQQAAAPWAPALAAAARSSPSLLRKGRALSHGGRARH